MYTARGRNAATYLSSCDLAHDGSPTIATLMSPRRLMPCQPAFYRCLCMRAFLPTSLLPISTTHMHVGHALLLSKPM